MLGPGLLVAASAIGAMGGHMILHFGMLRAGLDGASPSSLRTCARPKYCFVRNQQAA